MRQALVAVMVLGCSNDKPAAVDALRGGDAPVVMHDAPLVTVDAPAVADLACNGVAPPTTAPDPITLGGTVFAITSSGTMPVDAETVTSFKTGDATATGTTVSGTGGTFSLSLATAGAPLTGYLHIGHDGTYLDSYVFDSRPSYENFSGGQLPMVTQQTLDALVSTAGVTQSAANGTLSIFATDCDRNALAGVVITTTSSATVLYNNAFGFPDASGTMTNASGLAYLFDVPPGDVTISGMFGTKLMRSHTVTSFAHGTTFTALQP